LYNCTSNKISIRLKLIYRVKQVPINVQVRILLCEWCEELSNYYYTILTIVNSFENKVVFIVSIEPIAKPVYEEPYICNHTYYCHTCHSS